VTAGQVVDRSPIINDPFVEPARHWRFDPNGPPELVEGRRPAGYLPPDPGGRGTLDVTADTIPLDLVNDLRDRLRQWRGEDYRGATEVTKDLFAHWFDEEREAGLRPFYAQREAIETIAFLVEASADRRVGIDVPQAEAYERWCTKMATGTGKTLVMAMTIAWSVLNKAAARTDHRFADAVLVVCPNLTVKERLAGLDPQRDDNEYTAFGLIPPHLSGLLGQARVLVTNWHQLAPATDPKRSVLKRGPESDAAFCRRVLGPTLGTKRRILVLNDEAHHAYRFTGSSAPRQGEQAAEVQQATVWVDGLARIHRDREILRCHDFSATPMYPAGSGRPAGALFDWIISDFALVDAIEAGLVKIPRIPTDDNAGAAVPRYRNLWDHVRTALPRGARDEPDRGLSLTDYLTRVDGPLKQLGDEWEETFEQWTTDGRPVPPAMIVVCQDTPLAAVLEQHIAVKGGASAHLQNTNGATRTLRIDSRLLKQAEDRDELGAADAAEQIRRTVATVGKVGEAGQHIRCVISVAMLSEGWDARNVTQILGLRAFSSQLLCEQVVGRGLRRSSHDNLTIPEYVDVYGVPFQMLPFAKGGTGRRTPPPRTTSVVALRERQAYEFRFPRVVSIVHDVGQRLHVDRDALVALRVEPTNDPTVTRVEGVGSVVADEQDRRRTWSRYRRQKLVFELASRIIRGQPGLQHLFAQAMTEVAWYLDHRVQLAAGVPEGELDNEFYKTLIIQRIQDQLRPDLDHAGALLPVLDEYQPEGWTGNVHFITSKPVEPATKSHLNYVVCDSELERDIARALESDDRVAAYVKNDHLFCEIPYRFDARTLRYLPDFLVQLQDGRRLLIEGKGNPTTRDASKESAARRWVAAVNADGRWGQWSYGVVRDATKVPAMLATR
jgi:type III restriction enzyme